jgi:plasmid stabilization system protein ParE
VSRYLLSPAAQIDLEQIWDYTCHRWDVEQADEYLRELQRAIELASVNPRIGRACDEIRPSPEQRGDQPEATPLVTYDCRLRGAADALGMNIAAPGRTP